MKADGERTLELELYLLLGLTCSNCGVEWYAQDNGWILPNASEEDVSSMLKNIYQSYLGLVGKLILTIIFCVGTAMRNCKGCILLDTHNQAQNPGYAWEGRRNRRLFARR